MCISWPAAVREGIRCRTEVGSLRLHSTIVAFRPRDLIVSCVSVLDLSR